jgi:hypothetical protein
MEDEADFLEFIETLNFDVNKYIENKIPLRDIKQYQKDYREKNIEKYNAYQKEYQNKLKKIKPVIEDSITRRKRLEHERYLRRKAKLLDLPI